MSEELFVNISLIETLEQMKGYTKSIKDLFTRKRTMSLEPTDNFHVYSVDAS